MLSSNREYETLETKEVFLSVPSNLKEVEEVPLKEAQVTTTKFHGHYQDCMEMYAPRQTVAEYLDSHNSWFSRCAEPMTVQPLGENGYALVIGRFGAFGYEVEPKIGLELLAPEDGVYRILTIPVPGYRSPGYDVDYHSSLVLVENTSLGQLTQVQWELDLTVSIHFPKFIKRLPQSLIQSTGDRLLNQIIRQVSRRLTHKVQEDFHQSLGISFPKKR